MAISINGSGTLGGVITIPETVTITAAAPSLIPDALPAVTVPSLLNAGRSADNASSVLPALMYSSLSKIMLTP